MAPEDTTKHDPMIHLAGMMDSYKGGDVANYIYEMEKAGQSQFVNSDTLPKQCDDKTMHMLAMWGIQTIESETDDLFQTVKLPNGWKRIPTEHDMWSHVIDDQGRVRIEVFYKASSHDRRADMRISDYEFWELQLDKDMRARLQEMNEKFS